MNKKHAHKGSTAHTSRILQWHFDCVRRHIAPRKALCQIIVIIALALIGRFGRWSRDSAGCRRLIHSDFQLIEFLFEQRVEELVQTVGAPIALVILFVGATACAAAGGRVLRRPLRITIEFKIKVRVATKNNSRESKTHPKDIALPDVGVGVAAAEAGAGGEMIANRMRRNFKFGLNSSCKPHSNFTPQT